MPETLIRRNRERSYLRAGVVLSLKVVTHVNAINVIAPYRYHGMWVFDDPRAELVQEPFVSGADAIIDRAVAHIPDAHSGFLLLFSATPFPGHMHRLEWRRVEMDGNWYYAPDLDMEGWLCAALLKYFAEPPRELYLQVKAKPRDAYQSPAAAVIIGVVSPVGRI